MSYTYFKEVSRKSMGLSKVVFSSASSTCSSRYSGSTMSEDSLTSMREACNTYLTESTSQTICSQTGGTDTEYIVRRLVSKRIIPKLSNLRYKKDVRIELIAAGDVRGYLPLFRFLLMKFSRPVSSYLQSLGIQLSNNTAEFMADVFHISKEVLGVVPTLPLYSYHHDGEYVLLKARFFLCFAKMIGCFHNNLVLAAATRHISGPHFKEKTDIMTQGTGHSCVESSESTESHASDFSSSLGDTTSSIYNIDSDRDADDYLVEEDECDNESGASSPKCFSPQWTTVETASSLSDIRTSTCEPELDDLASEPELLDMNFWIGENARSGTWAWDDNDPRRNEEYEY